MEDNVIDRLLTPEQVADQVQLSVKTVMRAIRDGDLEASQLTRTRGGWRIRPDAINEWLDQRSNRNQSRRRDPAPVERITPDQMVRPGTRQRRCGAGRLVVTASMGRQHASLRGSSDGGT